LQAVLAKLVNEMPTSPHSSPTQRTEMAAEPGLQTLVGAARRGDPDAWSRLIARFDPMLRRVARSHRLGGADVDDVVQATWTLLYTHIDTIREPAAVAGWLATTVRRQALRQLRCHAREQLTADHDFGLVAHETPESLAIAAESHQVVRRALATLPERQRRVVTLLAAQPALDYRQLGSVLKMPIGSIGPTRARGLASLQRDAELRAFAAAA
jgi:RNA polymerase sigma factor (sigma-70 family)